MAEILVQSHFTSSLASTGPMASHSRTPQDMVVPAESAAPMLGSRHTSTEDADLKELYAENVPAKLVRVAQRDLKNNVIRFFIACDYC
jgi:hypothetical protein